MTKQKAWIELMHMLQENLNPQLTYEQAQDVMKKIEPLANMIKPLEPNPETGLMPCGCGGKGLLVETTGADPKYGVVCESCFVSTSMMDKESAIEVWNRAMGKDTFNE